MPKQKRGAATLAFVVVMLFGLELWRRLEGGAPLWVISAVAAAGVMALFLAVVVGPGPLP